jgi:hypothetical protein
VVVTALLAGFGRFPWSFAAGPVAALAVWSLERKARAPVTPRAVRRRRLRAPAPVD